MTFVLWLLHVNVLSMCSGTYTLAQGSGSFDSESGVIEPQTMDPVEILLEEEAAAEVAAVAGVEGDSAGEEESGDEGRELREEGRELGEDEEEDDSNEEGDEEGEFEDDSGTEGEEGEDDEELPPMMTAEMLARRKSTQYQVLQLHSELVVVVACCLWVVLHVWLNLFSVYFRSHVC